MTDTSENTSSPATEGRLFDDRLFTHPIQAYQSPKLRAPTKLITYTDTTLNVGCLQDHSSRILTNNSKRTDRSL